jgi:hypothetical protein
VIQNKELHFKTRDNEVVFSPAGKSENAFGIYSKEITMIHSRAGATLFCAIIGLSWALAQDSEEQKRQAREKRLIEQNKDDVFEELDQQSLTLRFFNALDGREITGGDVSVNGAQYTTDEEGKVLFPAPDTDGLYPVTFRAVKYVPVDFNIEIMAGTLFFNRFSVSPLLDVKFLRVVLDWDSSPSDLDAHLVKPGVFHLSFRNMRTAQDGSGQLDHDATNGYGPETITLKEVSPASDYAFFVHDYSDRMNASTRNLARSKATVKVFGDGRLLNVFEIPRNAAGNYWHVFRISKGGIVEVNRVMDREE